MKAGTYFPLTMLIIGVILLAISAQYPLRTGLVVWIVLSLMIILLVVEILKEVVWKRGNTGAIPKDIPQYLVGAAWIASILPMVYLVGLVMTTFLYTFVYLKFHGERWLLTIAVSLGITAIIYGVFELALEVPLYKGLLLSLI
ncbi:tripartite tricarboxylate transporter TctB family protein [Chloroflexota bacterium]